VVKRKQLLLVHQLDDLLSAEHMSGNLCTWCGVRTSSLPSTRYIQGIVAGAHTGAQYDTHKRQHVREQVHVHTHSWWERVGLHSSPYPIDENRRLLTASQRIFSCSRTTTARVS